MIEWMFMKSLKRALDSLFRAILGKKDNRPDWFLDLPDAPDFISEVPKLTPDQNMLNSKMIIKSFSKEWEKHPPSPEEFYL